MVLDKIVCLRIFILYLIASLSASAFAQETTLFKSIEQAIAYSPELQAVKYNREAIDNDIRQIRANYYPNLDVLLGYGLEQHSDKITRLPDSQPSDSDWDPRTDATLRLTQQIYDWGETGHRVGIEKKRLDSAQFQIQDVIQSITLDAIIAHLDVYRQRELVSLAEQDLKIHREILKALSEIEQSGAGDIGDVSQTKARTALAETVLLASKDDLQRASANYVRVVGVEPGELAYAEVPAAMPKSLEEALKMTEAHNPELMALRADVKAATGRIDLARSIYKPKFNLELSTSYHDQLEGDPSWQHTSDAMVVMRWNFYSGGRNKARINSALSRKNERSSFLDDQKLKLLEQTSETWSAYQALQRQRTAYRSAVDSSKKTFYAYKTQFIVSRRSRRSLLDVLNVEKEYFQYSRQLVSASVGEIISAYRILKLGGELEIQKLPEVKKTPEGLHGLSEGIVLPAAARSSPPEPRAESPRMAASPVQQSTVEKETPVLKTESETPAPAALSTFHSMEIGPCINQMELKKAEEIVGSHGLKTQKIIRTGPVKFTRLRVGIYPPKEAFNQLKALKKKVDSAFLLPENGKSALYAGSFHNSKKALRFKKLLEQKQINVTIVETKIKMQGTMLVVQQVEPQTAEMIAEKISKLGLTAMVVIPSTD